MRNEAITLVFAMGIGTILMAACDTPEQQAATSASIAERKDGAMPVQGHVDRKEPAQRNDFEQKKSKQRWHHVPLPAGLARGPEAIHVAITPPSLT